MDLEQILKAIVTLCVIGGVLVLGLLYLRRYGPFKTIGMNIGGLDKNLKLEEVLFIDTQNKVVVIRHHNTKYLLLLGHTSLVIDRVEKSVRDIPNV